MLEVLLVESFREDNSRINIVNIYNPDMAIEKEEMSGILMKLNGDIVICGDLSGHNSLWGSEKNYAYRNVIIEIINDFNLVCLNDGFGTRIDKSTGKMSCLDLTLVNMNIAPKCTWMVGDEKRKSEPKWSIKKADWNKFQSNCIQGIPLPDSNDPTDDIYNQFID